MIETKEGEEYFADLHIHSRFSRACSKDINIENLEKWARIKGIDLLGTGDFTHNKWLDELKASLRDNGKGVFLSKTGFKFLLTGEISLMYSTQCEKNEKGKDTKGRRVHLVLLAPSFEIVDKINAYFDTKGRRDYDGRPIFKVPADIFVKDMKNLDDKIEVIPAHIWTPWFGLFGSKSGFDSFDEAFGEVKNKIYAVETGISSTPQMNLRLKDLQKRAIVSFSDSHSFWPWRLGREATIFKNIESYDEIIREIRENDIVGTVEVNPSYGMYHYDGHRDCAFSCSPEETKKLNGICPKCNKPLTIGVEYRVDELANATKKIPGKKVYDILPLHEIIAASKKSAMTSKKVWEEYNKLIAEFGNEFNILIEVPLEKLLKFVDKKTAHLIIENRKGNIKVKPGYDGVYGEMVLER